MLAKLFIISVFFVILYNLFSSLKYLFGQNHDSDLVLKKLKRRIALSVALFVLIIIGFLSGFVKLHTL